MEKIKFCWKPATEVPTERWERNHNISPFYLVKCGTNRYGLPIIGYARFSYVTNEWMDCYDATAEGMWEVQAWTDAKL